MAVEKAWAVGKSGPTVRHWIRRMQHYAHMREAPRWGESENRQARMQLRQIGDQLQQQEYRYQQSKRCDSFSRPPLAPSAPCSSSRSTAVIRRSGGTDRMQRVSRRYLSGYVGVCMTEVDIYAHNTYMSFDVMNHVKLLTHVPSSSSSWTAPVKFGKVP